MVHYQAFFCLHLISPHPFTPQILTSSSVAHINLSVTSFLDTHSCPANIMVPSHSLGLQSPISSLTGSNSILHFIFHAPIFPQRCLFYRGNGSSKPGGSSNVLGSFYETIWCQILEDVSSSWKIYTMPMWEQNKSDKIYQHILNYICSFSPTNN